MSNKRRGFLSSYIGLLKKSARGALGGEYLSSASVLGRAAKGSLSYKSCPRCFEKSLLKQEGGWSCVRTDICGWTGGDDAVAQLASEEVNISPLVYGLSKGREVDVAREESSARSFSWVFWSIALLLVGYSGYCFTYVGAVTGVWAFLLAVLVSLHAIRFAFRAQFHAGLVECTPMQFLGRPKLWFVMR